MRSFAIAALLLTTAAYAQAPAAPPPTPMGLASSAFADGAIIPDKYTQASPAPVSPALAWTNAAAGTQSFALVVDDPDTALQHTTNEVLHWAAFNIPATATSLPEGVPNEAALPDGTNSFLSLSNVQTVNQGYYQVALANAIGGATSGPILLRIVPARATLISGPAPATIPAGQTAVFNAIVSGSNPLFVQWYKNGGALSGANASELVISNAQAADMGIYKVAISNALGSAVSAGATLTVLPSRPIFVLQPVSTGGLIGTNVVFQCGATGTDASVDPVNYTWYFQNAPLASQTNSLLTLSNITVANQGFYYVIATNLEGAATSVVAQLSIYLPPTFQATFSNQVVDAGSTVSFKVTVNGTAPLAYIWQWNQGYLTTTNVSLTLSNISPMASGYYSVTVTNLYGSACVRNG